jgi:hypothetical protein
MSEARRFYNILRGYVGREVERIQNLERSIALEELDAPTGAAPASAPGRPTPMEEMTLTGEEAKRRARQVLGVGDDASYHEVNRAYARLNKRSQPERFDEGSEEARHSELIQRKIQWAYQVLSQEASGLERRFGSLEVD